MNIGWPEGIVIAIMALNLVGSAALNGTPRKGNFNFPLQLCSTAFSCWLLWWGGLFA
jgi:hypothetical protein